ncbi:uncharacterized protein SPSK_04195 [Sporothrix schenckii 1099-18]|uniref:Uncharacterized protein n=1 Tax=Sporothrix schenckii 1099-18 TaxID=1397361 RepID=A0A0F2M192_SPOSC|nr:uncharacterized protein SPSK_04195 [Sporothrix schenckii 1099-18]KJR82874.1 hypothetical protein SPSK_04195 [Sporothrix schenckii 1099-18]
MEPDLSASITKHPHPFRLEHSAPASRSSSRTPGALDRIERSTDQNNASSTGVDYKPEEDDGAAVERHQAIHPASPSEQSALSSQTAGRVTDVEGQTTVGPGGAGRLPHVLAENDPYGLSSAYKTDKELEQIQSTLTQRKNAAGVGSGDDGSGGSSPGGNTRADGGVVSSSSSSSGGHANGASGQQRSNQGLLARCLPIPFPSIRFPGMPSFARRALQKRKLQGFYKSQNATIENMLKSVEEHQAEARQEHGDDQLRYRIAVYGSFAANLILAALQIYGAVSSGSLSLFTTMADAIFDPLSNVTLIVSNRAVKRVDPARFPSGKARLETVGNIVFCFLMTAVSFILIAFSIRELVEGRSPDEGDTKKFHLPSVLAVAIAFATKLALFFYTWAIKDRYSQVNILWQDHRNDLLINGFGLFTSVGGSKLVWWIDPAGAVLIGVIVSTIWLRTAFAEFLLLVGVVASVETQQLITYVCVTHSPAVQQIDTVRVYHSGPRLIAEVDVVMPQDATLGETHDVAEALQSKLECLPDVERAYVHVDYETTHKPEHAYKKDL